MSLTVAVLLAAGGCGLALLLDSLPWCRALPLHRRLAPYRADHLAATGAGRRSATLQLIETLTARGAALTGTSRSLARRLERAGSSRTPAETRSRRLSAMVVASLFAAATAVVWQPGWRAAAALVVGAGAGTVVADEARLASDARRRAERIRGELPVVAEQLGMLLSAGFSLPAALQRLAQRGSGTVADGLGQVVRRLRQGESERDALDAWARSTGVEGTERLVRVLTIHRQAGDLGQLISDEARAVRAEQHRALLESIARRGQLVWIPVTVATLVPGLVVLAVPFASAMAQITGQG
ncbi:MAG: type II secretion system F family protein [Actinomycetes bacterium]